MLEEFDLALHGVVLVFLAVAVVLGVDFALLLEGVARREGRLLEEFLQEVLLGDLRVREEVLVGGLGDVPQPVQPLLEVQLLPHHLKYYTPTTTPALRITHTHPISITTLYF
jgi:hypothetical protein